MPRKPLIMVVDDELDLLKSLTEVLVYEGFDVITADSGVSALVLREERRPDLVLLDIMMPGFDGVRILELIRARSDVPVIMLTAKYDLGLLREAMLAGADDYVTKPFSVRVLVARIRAKLRRTMAGAQGELDLSARVDQKSHQLEVSHLDTVLDNRVDA